MDRGAWRAAVHDFAESDMTEQLTRSLSHFLLLTSCGPWESLSTFPNFSFLKLTVRI